MGNLVLDRVINFEERLPDLPAIADGVSAFREALDEEIDLAGEVCRTLLSIPALEAA